MSGGLGPRLRRLEGKVGWKLTTLRKRNGEELVVRSEILIDAWLKVMWGAVPNLSPRVSGFLAEAVLRPADGEMLVTLNHFCRGIWPAALGDVPAGEPSR